jgi:hypothetical protein
VHRIGGGGFAGAWHRSLRCACAPRGVHRHGFKGPVAAGRVKAELKAAFDAHGAPIVLNRDGGSIFNEASVMELHQERGVAVLTCAPHDPQHNGKKERSFRDLPQYNEPRQPEEPRLERRIALALGDLNPERPGPVLCGRTSAEVHAQGETDRPERPRVSPVERRRQRKGVLSTASQGRHTSARRCAVVGVPSKQELGVGNRRCRSSPRLSSGHELPALQL